MSSSSDAHSDSRGSFPQGNAPWVLVRAEKTFLCSACGTLVEIPADVGGQLVIAYGHAPSARPVAEEATPPEPTTDEPAREDSPPAKQTPFAIITPDSSESPTNFVAATSRRNASVSQAATNGAPLPSRPGRPRPARPRRPKQPKPRSFAGEIIDGLIVPSAQQLDRALAWISFHLKVLDRQGEEIKRLKKLLKTRKQPKPRAPQAHPAAKHAHTQVGIAPRLNSTRERGPP